MLQKRFGRALALISTATGLTLATPAMAQNGPSLPPLPAADPVTTEINQLEQESANLSQEARELGGGDTIRQATDNVRNDFYQKQAQGEDLEHVDRVLRGDGGDRRCAVDAVGGERLEVGLDPGPAARVGSRDGEDDLQPSRPAGGGGRQASGGGILSSRPRSIR